MAQIKKIPLSGYGYHILNNVDGSVTVDFPYLYRIPKQLFEDVKKSSSRTLFKGSDDITHAFLIASNFLGEYGLHSHNMNFYDSSLVYEFLLNRSTTKSYKNAFDISYLNDVGIDLEDFSMLLHSFLANLYKYNNITKERYTIPNSLDHTQYGYVM